MTSPEPLPRDVTDALTVAAARDTGMPGFRIVSTAPPESALPPLPPEELARRRRDPWPLRLWRWTAMFVSFFIGGVIVARLKPEARGGDLPPLEWFAWILIGAAIVAIPWVALVDGVPWAVRRVRSMRSGGH